MRIKCVYLMADETLVFEWNGVATLLFNKFVNKLDFHLSHGIISSLLAIVQLSKHT